MRVKKLSAAMGGLLFCAVTLMPLAACEKKGPMEELGETIDDAVDDAKDAVEEIGDEVEDTADEIQDEVEDGGNQ